MREEYASRAGHDQPTRELRLSNSGIEDAEGSWMKEPALSMEPTALSVLGERIVRAMRAQGSLEPGASLHCATFIPARGGLFPKILLCVEPGDRVFELDLTRPG